MKKTKFSIQGLLDNNKILLLISFVIALIIWVTVTPQRTMTINCPVTLSTKSSPAEKLGLDVIEGAEQVIGVTVSGEWYTISELSADDILISYSFGGIVDAGEYEITVTATKKNNASGFTIEDVTPDTIKVSMDHISTVNMPIEVVTNNITTDDEFIVGTPIIDNDKGVIEITGPATKLKKLSKVVAEVNVEDKLLKSEVFTSELKFLNKNGKEMDVSQFTIPYTEVDVIVPINQSKIVPVKVQFENAPDAFKSNPISYTISVDSLEIIGTKEALSKIENILLDPIDYNKITPENNTFKISLNLPLGVSASNGLTEVEVKIDTSGLSSKTLNISKFTTVNAAKTVVSSFETTYKSVVVVGPESVINNISSSDVYIECDMSNTSGASGNVTVQGVVKSSKYKTIWGTGDCEIQIKVK